MDASAYSGDVTVNVGLDEVPVDPIAGDTGVDAASEADADADLEQLADQSNVNSQAATTTGSFSASPTFTGVALVAGAGTGNHDIEIAAGIEDVEVEVEQEQEDIEQSNDADQSGEVYAEAYSGYVDVLQRSGDLLTAGGTGIEAESRAEAEADLDQTAVQSNSNSQTANTSLSFTANPTFGTETGPATAGSDLSSADPRPHGHRDKRRCCHFCARRRRDRRRDRGRRGRALAGAGGHRPGERGRAEGPVLSDRGPGDARSVWLLGPGSG